MPPFGSRSWIKDKSVVMSGMNALMSLYLRDDLLFSNKYGFSWNGQLDGLPIETRYFACNPRMVKDIHLHGGKGLFGMNTVWIGDGSKDEDANSLLWLKAHHPIKRLKFVYGLCYSSEMAIGLHKLRKLRFNSMIFPIMHQRFHDFIDEMYNSFDSFSKCWGLYLFDDLKNNVDAQIAVHEKFKMIIQALMGLSLYFAFTLRRTDDEDAHSSLPLDQRYRTTGTDLVVVIMSIMAKMLLLLRQMPPIAML